MQEFADYTLERELGRGATARIYLARRHGSESPVSLKIFHPSLFQDPVFQTRIQREMKLSTELKHKNIVAVHEVLQLDPPALVMEYVDGENLEKFQSRLPYVLPEISVLIVIEILKALEYAHSRHLVHRDLKPENVLVRKDGEVLVTDFGLAKVQDSSALTMTNAIVGSLDYMSPEQATGQMMTASSDLFSVGAILYFLTTGTRPFSRATPMATLEAIQTSELEAPQKCNPKISGNLSRIISKALSKKEEQRYLNATEFRRALEGYLDSVGLGETELSMKVWSNDPSARTLESLRRSVEYLSARCQAYLKTRDMNEFLEAYAHLSLKAPQSPLLLTLMKDYREILKKRRRPFALFGAVLGIILFIGLGFALNGILNRKADPIAEAVLPKVSESQILFNVPEDVTVFWDGQKKAASVPFLAEVGPHRLRMTRKGHAPIESTVQVKDGEPLVVNVR